jgi:hypothetical protein
MPRKKCVRLNFMSNPATMRLPPRRARFAWSKLAIANLMNADGLLPETRINRQKNGGRRIQRATLLPTCFFANRAVFASPQE